MQASAVALFEMALRPISVCINAPPDLSRYARARGSVVDFAAPNRARTVPAIEVADSARGAGGRGGGFHPRRGLI